MTHKILHLVLVFAASLTASLIFTPLVRALARKMGMVDKPDPRRINKVPIPRGGGLAVFLASTLVEFGFIFHEHISVNWSLFVLVTGIVALGLLDDRFSLAPKAKLLGQVVIAGLAWLWGDLGFQNIWPMLPKWLDFLMTVFWIVGAVNAFNLIDGLDGLATGLAFIATLGMAGSLILTGNINSVVTHFAFAGALLGFLRYNYNPASVFLGDCGSMYIGFVLSTLPLTVAKTQCTNSVLLSVGIPILAMGVPIVDTSLAILRRSIRRLLVRADDNTSAGKVMNADCDHLHHRLLRSLNFSQRKVAWTLYAFAIFLVAVGLVGLSFESRSAGLWFVAVCVATVVIVRDMTRVELFDAGRLLNSMAHTKDMIMRRRLARMAVPFYLFFDVLAMVAIYLFMLMLYGIEMNRQLAFTVMPLRVICCFVMIVLCRGYRTVWARALTSNFVRLWSACFVGTIVSSVILYYYLPRDRFSGLSFAFLFAFMTSTAVCGIRMLRGYARNFFYEIDCSRLVTRRDVSRVLIYGAGLRYRAFRRELVRRASNNDRIIVGIVDDDVLLKNHFIGGVRIFGTLDDVPTIINELNVDTVVVACDVDDEVMERIRNILSPTGVKIRRFEFVEHPLSIEANDKKVNEEKDVASK